MDSGHWIWIALGALAAGGLLSSFHHAVREASRKVAEDLASARPGTGCAARVRAILDDAEGHANALGLPRTACNLLVVVATVLWIAGLRQNRAAPEWLEVILGVAAASVLVWVVGLVIPVAVARHAAEETVCTWARVIRAVYVIGRPVRGLVAFLDEVVRRLAGERARDEARVLEKELLSVVEEARQEGKVGAAETEMIEAVMRFRDTTVGQIMTPRTEIEALESTADLGAVTALIRDGNHSRIPVYEDSLDQVVGIFYVKDLMKWLAGEGSRSGRTFSLRALLRPAIFVPETKTIRELMAELLQKKVHVAMVADEYGGTAGLVTIEDIMEEIVGEIQDEYEQTDDRIPEVKIDRAKLAAEIDARAYVQDANARLRTLGVALPESEDYDTVGGFVTVTLGRIPLNGEQLRHGTMLLTVLEAAPTRVSRVRLEVLRGGAPPRPDAPPPGR